MALSTNLQTIVDAKIDELVSQLSTIQETYKTTHGKYWQGISCTSSIPADGNTAATDTSVKPTDQAEDWSNVNGVGQGIVVDATLPVLLAVDSYYGPIGHGYAVIGQVTELGKTYARTVNIGPETFREYGWVMVGEL